MRTRFKKGEWIIRKYSDSNGEEDSGRIDIARVKRNVPEVSYFYATMFFSFYNCNRITDFSKDGRDEPIEYFDKRMEYDWRLANKKELKKYFSKINKPIVK